VETNLVAVVRVMRDVLSSVHEGISLIGGIRNAGAERAIIKPNLCHTSAPETGRTTDVRVVKGVLEEISAQEPREIHVVESDSLASSADRTFRKLGYEDLEKRPFVNLTNLSKETSTSKAVDGKFFKRIEVPEALSSYGLLISVAKLKTHLFERLSGVYKNQYGLLPFRERRPYHPFLSEVLFDVNTLYKPDLCVIDGLVGMEGCGPIDGTPKSMNLLIFGRNALATDSVACAVIGIDPFDVPYLKYAYENGMGELNLERIRIVGESVENVRSQFEFVPDKAYSYMRNGLRLGRYPPPLKNLGILLFTWGNFKAGKTYSTRLDRQREDKAAPSPWKLFKNAVWTRSWNV